MTNALVVYESPDDVRKDLDVARVQLAEVLPAHMTVDRYVRVVAKAVIGNPKLMECTRTSLLSSVMEAAQLGLEPTGLLGSAYLVPYRVTVKAKNERGALVEHKVMEAKLIPGYRGLIDLARRSGEIDAIQADVVRLRDVFDYEPTRQPNPVIHRPYIPDPSLPPEERDRGPIVGVYMVATLRGGFRQPEWMTAGEVDDVRKRSRAADDGPWVTDYPEMARKTVVRRGAKYLPLTTEFRRALELDEEAERGAEPPTVSVSSVPRATALLGQRARERAEDAASAARDVTGSPDSSPDGNGALSGSDSPTSEPNGAGTGETGDPGPVEPPATPVQPVCGATHVPTDGKPSLGTCQRSPHETGGHKNDLGAWPR